MCKIILINFEIIGITTSFIGSIVLAFSVIKNPGDAHQFKKGKKIYLASINGIIFKWGVALIAIGFALQILSKFL